MSIRDRREDESQGRWALFLFLASVIFHVAIFTTLHEMPEPERKKKRKEYEVAVMDIPEPKKPPKPLPPPPPPPEIEEPPPPPPPTSDDPPPPPKQPKRIQQKPKAPPPSDELPPPPKIRLPSSQVVSSGSGSPVAVNVGGSTATPGRIQGSDDGKVGGKPKQDGQGTGGTGTAPTGPKWAPKSDIFIKKMPLPKKRPPKLQCPASRERGLYGTVVLSVDVRRDGTVRGVKVVRGIGGGCDEVAKKAIKKMTMSPAVGTDGKVADYAGLRYEYVFEPPA